MYWKPGLCGLVYICGAILLSFLVGDIDSDHRLAAGLVGAVAIAFFIVGFLFLLKVASVAIAEPKTKGPTR